MRPPIERPPNTTRSGGTLAVRASSAAASRTAASSTGGRSGDRRPAALYGKLNRSDGTLAAASASATVVRVAAFMSAPAPCASSTARSAPRFGPWYARSVSATRSTPLGEERADARHLVLDRRRASPTVAFVLVLVVLDRRARRAQRRGERGCLLGRHDVVVASL